LSKYEISVKKGLKGICPLNRNLPSKPLSIFQFENKRQQLAEKIGDKVPKIAEEMLE